MEQSPPSPLSSPADLTCRSDIIKIIFAIFLPPLGVFLERGCNADFLINILLTVLGYIPGIIHALYVFPFLPKLPSRAKLRLCSNMQLTALIGTSF